MGKHRKSDKANTSTAKLSGFCALIADLEERASLSSYGMWLTASDETMRDGMDQLRDECAEFVNTVFPIVNAVEGNAEACVDGFAKDFKYASGAIARHHSNEGNEEFDKTRDCIATLIEAARDAKTAWHRRSLVYDVFMLLDVYLAWGYESGLSRDESNLLYAMLLAAAYSAIGETSLVDEIDIARVIVLQDVILKCSASAPWDRADTVLRASCKWADDLLDEDDEIVDALKDRLLSYYRTQAQASVYGATGHERLSIVADRLNGLAYSLRGFRFLNLCSIVCAVRCRLLAENAEGELLQKAAIDYALCCIELNNLEDALCMLLKSAYGVGFDWVRNEPESSLKTGGEPIADFGSAAMHENIAFLMGLVARRYDDACLCINAPVAFNFVDCDGSINEFALLLRRVALQELKVAEGKCPQGLSVSAIRTRAVVLYDLLACALHYGDRLLDTADLEECYFEARRFFNEAGELGAEGFDIEDVGSVADAAATFIEVGLFVITTVVLHGGSVGGGELSRDQLAFRVEEVLNAWALCEASDDARAAMLRGSIGATLDRLGDLFDGVSIESAETLLRSHVLCKRLKKALRVSVVETHCLPLGNEACKCFVALIRKGVWDLDCAWAQRVISGVIDYRIPLSPKPPDIAYYASCKSVCRLFEDRYYPRGTKRSFTESELISKGIDRGEWGDPSNCLTLMHASYMNDPSEGISLFSYLASSTSDTPSSSSVVRMRDSLFDDAFLFLKSFTTQIDRLHMWSMYGHGAGEEAGSGCCVCINPATFRQNRDVGELCLGADWWCSSRSLKPCSSPRADLYRVVYIAQADAGFTFSNGERAANGSFARDLKALKSVWGDSRTKAPIVQKAILDELIEVAFLFKDSSYENELEMRLVVKRGSSPTEMDSIELIERRDGLPLYCVRPSLPVYVDKIVLGPNVDDAHILIPHLRYKLAKMRARASEEWIDLRPSVDKSLIPLR